MDLYGLLDATPVATRTGLLVATAAVLAAATLGLPLAALSVVATDVVVLAVALAIGGGWWAVFRSLPSRPDDVEAAVRHRGLIAGRWLEHASTVPAARLPEVDPSYSLLAWCEGIERALAPRIEGVVGPVSVVGVDDGEIVARAQVRRPDGTLGWIEALLRQGPDQLVCESHRDSAEPVPCVDVDPAWPAARRALLAREEALDLDGFEALFAQIVAEVDRLAAADETTRAASPYLTAAGARSLAFWADGPGIPPASLPAAWLSIEEDAWHERIEVQCGLRVLGLCRAAGEPGAPWQLWRLRRGT